jgi:hypothetical protein
MNRLLGAIDLPIASGIASGRQHISVILFEPAAAHAGDHVIHEWLDAFEHKPGLTANSIRAPSLQRTLLQGWETTDPQGTF